MLARNKIALFDGAFFCKAPETFEEEFHPFPAAQPANSFAMSCQVLLSFASVAVPKSLKSGHGTACRAPTTVLRQTRRRFGGRQPLCGTGVTSLIALMCKPEDASARTADSRPAPGPFTRTSTDFIPYWSRATPAAVAAACCAAYGVPLREPLKPTEPAEDQLTARPSGSVSVTIVLLNVAWMHTTPCGTTRFSFFLRNSFLRLELFAAAAAAGAPPGAAAASFGSFATLVSLLSF